MDRIHRTRFDKIDRVLANPGKGDAVRVKQNMAEECDINHIMRKYQKSGLLPATMRGHPLYGDFASSQDFHSAMELIARSNEQFASLPSAVRTRFRNDPAEFLAFASDPKNGREMVEMGLAEAKPREASKKPGDDPKRKPAKPAADPDPDKDA